MNGKEASDRAAWGPTLYDGTKIRAADKWAGYITFQFFIHLTISPWDSLLKRLKRITWMSH
jgi:hypothetical protein